MERSVTVIARVVMFANKWNSLRICSTSCSEHEETVASATMVGEGMMRTGSSGTIVLTPGGGCGATIA